MQVHYVAIYDLNSGWLCATDGAALYRSNFIMNLRTLPGLTPQSTRGCQAPLPPEKVVAFLILKNAHLTQWVRVGAVQL